MSGEEERLRHLLRKVTDALGRRGREYDESQRALVSAREDLRSRQAEVDGLTWQVSDLQAENDRLRELLGKYATAASYLCGRVGGCCDCNLDCASCLGSDPHGWDCARMLLDREARELGVDA